MVSAFGVYYYDTSFAPFWLAHFPVFVNLACKDRQFKPSLCLVSRSNLRMWVGHPHQGRNHKIKSHLTFLPVTLSFRSGRHQRGRKRESLLDRKPERTPAAQYKLKVFEIIAPQLLYITKKKRYDY